MAKKSMVNREVKREKLTARHAVKRAALKAVINDQEKPIEERFAATLKLAEMPRDLITSYPQLPVDVLKAGHHGSKGSSYPEFLDHIGAKIALISAGENNRYQHPHKETLERLDSQNMQVYRTDLQGAIRFRGWKQWSIETVKE